LSLQLGTQATLEGGKIVQRRANFKNQRELEAKIGSLLDKPLRIRYKGPQGVGNTWQGALGIMIDNKPVPDYHGIEVKCLTCEGQNLKSGSDLTLTSKTPDWELLNRFGITESSFFHQIDYGYIQMGRCLFFNKRLRYVASTESRSIEWYLVPRDFLPTEPYSNAPKRSGTHVFSWGIETLLKKINKLSLTIVKKNGEYPEGTITPIRSYIVDMYPDKILRLLADGSIRYEVRRAPAKGMDPLWKQVENEAKSKFDNHPSSNSWEWADERFAKRGGKWHDHGTGFRLGRQVLNSLLDLEGEILPKRSLTEKHAGTA
jgi:hypothetical protein